MKFLREYDEKCLSLASMQAELFKRSSLEKLPSYFFIQSFLNDPLTKEVDDLTYLYSNYSSSDLYFAAKKGVPSRKDATIYSPLVMHWMGYFYRSIAYLCNLSSKKLFTLISPKYLSSVYPLYHALDIRKAIELVLNDIDYHFVNPNERFKQLFMNNIHC